MHAGGGREAGNLFGVALACSYNCTQKLKSRLVLHCTWLFYSVSFDRNSVVFVKTILIF